jgi:hypothetical protein
MDEFGFNTTVSLCERQPGGVLSSIDCMSGGGVGGSAMRTRLLTKENRSSTRSNWNTYATRTSPA